jgi:bifunctional DNA-binding transcriptional regulator/antitoxin component of YhaV-PrlF toxin-antitoxin module
MSHVINPEGMVEIPESIRENLGLTTGSAVTFQLEPGGRAVLRKDEPATPAAEPSFDERVEAARAGFNLHGMTVDEFMEFLRGEPD